MGGWGTRGFPHPKKTLLPLVFNLKLFPLLKNGAIVPFVNISKNCGRSMEFVIEKGNKNVFAIFCCVHMPLKILKQREGD